MAADLVNSLGNITQKVIDDLPDIKANFKTYQRSRSACVVEALKLQASAWCLSCDPNYASKGVTNENVLLSNTVCNRLQSSCYDFVSQSASQSAILAVKSLSPLIQTVTSSFNKIIQNDTAGISELGSSLQALTNSNSILNVSQAETPVVMPSGCTGIGSCSWICTDLFNRGQINETLLSLGGSTDYSSSNTSGLLHEVLEEGSIVKTKLMNWKRGLIEQAEWNPERDEAGVLASFPEDPANVNVQITTIDDSTASGSGLIQGSIVCLMAFISIFVI